MGLCGWGCWRGSHRTSAGGKLSVSGRQLTVDLFEIYRWIVVSRARGPDKHEVAEANSI